MYTIKVYVNNELTKIIEDDNKLLMIERYIGLTEALEQYIFNRGYAKVDLYVELYDENGKIIKEIEF